MTQHFVSKACRGERCRICGSEATHKVGEEMLFDDPQFFNHNVTAYVCCECFKKIFGETYRCMGN